MTRWYNKVEEAGLHSFNVIAATFYEHYEDILNFYNNLFIKRCSRVVQCKD